jgi:hypothetical protein
MARTRYKPEEIVAGGRNPPNRGERGDVLSVAPGVWRAEDRADEAPEGPGAREQPKIKPALVPVCRTFRGRIGRDV